VALIVSVIGLLAYCGQMLFSSGADEQVQRRQDARAEARHMAAQVKSLEFVYKMKSMMDGHKKGGDDKSAPLLGEAAAAGAAAKWKTKVAKKHVVETSTPDVEQGSVNADEADEEHHSEDSPAMIWFKLIC